MERITTFPTLDELAVYERATPDFMHPNKVPIAVIAEGFLSKAYCNDISYKLSKVEGESYEHCGALTRDIGRNASLADLEAFGHFFNETYWQYDLDKETHTWLQTYEIGGNYKLHMDGAPGRMRKLTAVVFLTHEDNYDGGDLTLYFHPLELRVPRTQGTMVLFPPWILHDVSRVTGGTRQTLNVSYWGPNFR